MSYLQNLPDELIAKIFHNLLEDPDDYKSLLWTCKRFCELGNNLIVSMPEWRDSRLFDFNLELPLGFYLPQLCPSHGLCSEQNHRTKTSCELQQETQLKEAHKARVAAAANSTTAAAARYQLAEIQDGRGPAMSSVSSQTSSSSLTELNLDDDHRVDNPNNGCYYHRLYCMLTAKYLTFSSIKFRNTRLSDRGCMRAFRDSKQMTKQMAEVKLNPSQGMFSLDSRPKLNAIVELELYNCDISLDWLNTILNELDNIAYLALVEVSFVDPNILVEPKDMASRTLKRLKISGDRTCRINDSIFTYFLDYFPATTLDLTGTRVEFHKRIIQRFYPYGVSLDLYSMHPSELLLTFPMILLYLKKYSSLVDYLIVDQTDITLAAVKKLLQDSELENLMISVKQCRMISQQERLRLAEHIDPSDMYRVLF